MLRKLLLPFLGAILLFAPISAQAAVTVDAVGTAQCVGTTSPTTCATLTIGAALSNSVVVAYLGFGYSVNPTLAATWNGVAMTNIGQQYSVTNSMGTAVFCLAAPASGTQTLSITATGGGSLEIHTIAASFKGANQTTPCKNYASLTDGTAGASQALSVTSATGDIPTAVSTQPNHDYSATSGTTIVIDNSGPSLNFAANYDTGASSVSMNFTATASNPFWEISGVDIAAAGGGGATSGGQITTMGIGD